MTIFESVRNEIRLAMLSGNAIRKENLKYLLGLFQNKSKNIDKTVTDVEAVAIIKSTLKGVIETQRILTANPSQYADQIEKNAAFIAICNEFLPVQATEAEIRAFIATIDKSTITNINSLIGRVIKNFNGNADGNLVKSIIATM